MVSYEDADFNTDEYIVEKLNLTEHELNAYLVTLHKEINLLKNQKAELLKHHFSKFIAANSVVNKIKRERGIESINIDLKNISYLRNKIESQFKNIMDRANINIQEEHEEFQRQRILEKFHYFFNGEEILTEFFQTKSYDEFISTYKKIERQYRKIKESKYATEIFKKIRRVKNRFLDLLVSQIERRDLPPDEILFYFSLYFKINDRSEQEKMENTLFVNFKIYLSEEFNNIQLNGIDVFFNYYIKILNLTRKFFIREKIIEEFFEVLGAIYEKSDFNDITLLRIFVDKMGLLLKIMRDELSNIIIVSHLKFYRALEKKICKNLLAGCIKILKKDIQNNKKRFEQKIKKTHDLFGEGIIRREIEKIILGYANYNNWKDRRDSINYLRGINLLEDKIHSIEKVLLIYNEKFGQSFLNKVRTKITKEEILAFADLKIEDRGDFEILMLAVIYKHKIPLSFEKLLFAQKKIFFKNNVRKYFLQKNEKIALNSTEKNEVEKLDIYFSFLREK